MKKKVIVILVALILVGSIGGTWLYSAIYSSTTRFSGNEKELFLRKSFSAEELAETLLLDSIISNRSDFLLTAKLKNFKSISSPGRYVIQEGISNSALINKLRIQAQTPVKFRFGQESTLNELAGKLGKVLLQDSVAFAHAFEEEAMAHSPEFNAANFPCLFMPDTYEVYWNISPKAFIDKMHDVYEKFWTDERRSKAASLGYSPQEICTLASIVKKETGKIDEAPKIAGLYLNRLRIGMELESDPTALFASGNTDVDRVRGQIGIESDYNTYHVAGLPPGPIALTEGVYIDAVLNAESHNYLFMCAKPERNGYHNFSRTFEQHLQYARSYWRSLDEAGIR